MHFQFATVALFALSGLVSASPIAGDETPKGYGTTTTKETPKGYGTTTTKHAITTSKDTCSLSTGTSKITDYSTISDVKTITVPVTGKTTVRARTFQLPVA